MFPMVHSVLSDVCTNVALLLTTPSTTSSFSLSLSFLLTAVTEPVLGDVGQQLVTDFILQSFQKLYYRNEVDIPQTLKIL